MKLSYTDIKNGMVRVNPSDLDTKSHVHQYNRSIMNDRLDMIEAQRIGWAIVIYNVLMLSLVSLLKAWKLWTVLLYVGVNILLIVLREIKVRPLRSKPGYPKFYEINIIEDEDVPYTPPKKQVDELGEYLEKMERQESLENFKPWSGN